MNFKFLAVENSYLIYVLLKKLIFLGDIFKKNSTHFCKISLKKIQKLT